MGFLAFAILGILAGIIARLILPGKQGGGFWASIVLGILGGMIGGWIAGMFGLDVYGPNAFWTWQAWLFAIAGSLVVLLVWGLITRNRAKGKTAQR